MFTTTKEEAFAAPKWAYVDTDAFDAGDNALSKEETLLCEAYEALGRSDLSDCVKGGRVFHRLEQITGCWRPSSVGEVGVLAILNGLTDAMLGAQSGYLPQTLDHWIQEAMAVHAEDPDLPLMIRRNGDAKVWLKKRAIYDNNPFGGVVAPVESEDQ